MAPRPGPRLHRPGPRHDLAARVARRTSRAGHERLLLQHLAPVVGRPPARPSAFGAVRRQHFLSRQAHARLLRRNAAGRAGRRALPVGRRPARRRPQRAADRRAGFVGVGVRRARPSADRRPVRRSPRRRHRRLRAVSLRAHRPPGAAVADVDAAGPARAARARRAATPGGRSGARRLPRRPAAVQHLLRRLPRGVRRRRLDRAGRGAGTEAAPRAVHGSRGDPARPGGGSVSRPVRRQPRRARSPLGHRDRPAQRAAGRLPRPCPPSTCCAAATTGPKSARSTRGRRRSASPCSRSWPRAAACDGSISPWRRSRSMRRSACTACRSACCRPRCHRSATCARRRASPASP